MEEELADTQENTQNTLCYTSPLPESQPLLQKEPWGRLYKKHLIRKRFGTTVRQVKTFFDKADDDYFDICGESHLFGRDFKSCDYAFAIDKTIDQKILNRISKIHFGLYRNGEEEYISIKDFSRHGTFINGELIGQNESCLIKTGDEISIIEHDFVVFEFKDLVLRKLVDLPDCIKNKYFVSSLLGSGAYGEVFKLFDRQMQPFAVKYLKGPTLKQKYSTTENEIKILKKINHVCIIKTHDILRDQSGGACLILEFMEGGDLMNRIKNSSQRRLSEDISRFIFFQVTEAINYLHQNLITHRDIKPDNVLLKDVTEFPLVKLTDFGLSKIMEDGKAMQTVIGTTSYVAPEILHPDNDKYTSKVDIWSMGVMLYAMLSGSLPFVENNGSVQNQILSGKFKFNGNSWNEVSVDAKRFIKKMLEVDPECRISIAEIFELPWMDETHYGIRRAVQVMEDHGGTISRLKTRRFDKENEGVSKRSLQKRTRNEL